MVDFDFTCFIPGADLTGDEQLARLAFTWYFSQHLLSKPVKYGTTVRFSADAVTLFSLNSQTDVGSKPALPMKQIYVCGLSKKQ